MRCTIILIPLILFFVELNSLCQTTNSSKFQLTQTIRTIDNISVVIKQYKALISSPDVPYCKAYIYVLKDNIVVDSLGFNEIEPVGGDYGLLINKGLINNHIIISKFGDYDGRTIIINNKGQIFNIVGGYSFADTTNGLLFSNYCSDLFGFSVFDLNRDSKILEISEIENEPIEFYKDSTNKYYLKTINNETKKENFWEINFNKKKIIFLDKNVDKSRYKLLYKLADYNKINIECK